MNDRRQALIGKFRASALDRLRRLLVWLDELAAGEAPGRMQELKRELHTLKGESTMLGFGPMADVIHAAETRLVKAGEGGPDALREGFAAVAAGCEAVIRSLQGEGDGAMELAAARQALDRPEVAARPVSHERSPESSPEVEPAAAHPQPKQPAVQKDQRWVQVQARRIDELCERASDFEVTFRALGYELRELVESKRSAEGALRALLPELDRARASLEEITAAAWALRLVPLESSLHELVSHARDIAASQGKRMRAVVRGSDAQIERTVLDVIWEPLLHLVRNAVDHGIEAPAERGDKGVATLAVEAEAAGASVRLSISDDGRGIDVARVREAAVARNLMTRETAADAADAAILDLIFLHGFSTRAAVTDLSGRGVGLDVVRSSVESLGGSVQVSSELGKGTRFVLSIPATISKERSLVFPAGKAFYALPSRAVLGVVQLEDPGRPVSTDGRALRFGGEDVSLRSIGAALGPVDPTAEPWAAVVDVGTRRVAFSMERPLGEIPLLRRPVDRLLAASGAVNGSAILDDGRIVLMLAAPGLVRQSDRKGHGARQARQKPRRARTLVVDDSVVVRDLMAQVLTHAGFDVEVASGGRDALNAFAARRPDAVLLDIDMPDLDGFEVLRRIRDKDGAIPVVMLSLRASPADRQRASLLGASDYFAKSQFEEVSIVDALRRLVGPS